MAKLEITIKDTDIFKDLMAENEYLKSQLKELDCTGCSVTSKFYDYSKLIDKIFDIIKDEEEDFKLSTIASLILKLRDEEKKLP